jgi:mannitol 2-dehydrogenase
MKLNHNNLTLLPSGVQKPAYIRNIQRSSIVHIGVGGFHRAHQACYLDELLNKYPDTEWAICGIGLKKADKKIHTILKQQDYFYTVMIKHPNGTIESRVIGSIGDYLFAYENPAGAIEKLADRQIRIVSLTITEGGYNFDQSGKFIFNNPDVQWDMDHPEKPKTVFGLLAAALKIRKEKHIPAFTVLSCDNLQHNGDITRKMLLSFVERIDNDLSGWIEENVCFPNSMVDRITPVTTPDDIRILQEQTGIEDAWPVVCEPYIQWVMEDKFSDGRPVWEQVGVQFVKDIDPFEKMKIRLLNAGHSFLGFTGSLVGYHTIDETVCDPLLRQSLRAFMDEEVTPILGNIEGIDLEEYKDNLFRRFENPNIKDQLARICSESSAKLPKFLIPTIREQLGKNGPIKYSVFALAAWRQTLELYGTGKYNYPIQDDRLDELVKAATVSESDNPLAFIEIQAVFGNLSHSPRFVEIWLSSIDRIRKQGVKEALLNMNTQ